MVRLISLDLLPWLLHLLQVLHWTLSLLLPLHDLQRLRYRSVNRTALVKNLSAFQSFICAWSEILPHRYTIIELIEVLVVEVWWLSLDISSSSYQLPSPPNLDCFHLISTCSCCMVYAPPNATVEYHSELINYLQTLPTQVVILGDFNLPDINWSTLTGSLTTFVSLFS